MAISNIRTSVRNEMADDFCDEFQTGSTDPAGDFAGFTAAFATLLFECEASNPAFGAAAAGVATANAISDDTSANASGTAAVGRLRDRDNSGFADFTIGVGTGDLQMNTVTITAGDRVGISSATVTQPAA